VKDLAEIDRDVATKVFGLKLVPAKAANIACPDDFPDPDEMVIDTQHGTHKVPLYSKNLWHAMEVIEAMEKRGYWVKITGPWLPSGPGTSGLWNAGFTPHGTTAWNGKPDYAGSGHTMPEAICIAALCLVDHEPNLPPEGT
jgi:hypothetical protein